MTEHTVANRLVRNIINRGYTVSVWEGEDWALRRSANLQEIMESLASTGEDVLLVKDGEKTIGRFWLVWGNDPSGEELIADYTDNALCSEIYGEVMSPFSIA